MKRGPLTAVTAITAVLLAATGCGTVHTTGTGTGPSADASPSAQAGQAQQAAAEQARQVLTEHDRRYPEVARGCATATETPRPSASVPLDPEAAKYAENHGYKQTARLTAPVQCRGDAHAARIRAALTARKAGNATDVQTVLESLGYPRESIRVTAYGGSAGFTLEVPGAGPCIEGRPGGGPLSVEAHGYYMEGGCTEPKGGH
ncbi:hypothetical protein ACWDRR_26505 [Kitasatospora sp. NPDC003701]